MSKVDNTREKIREVASRLFNKFGFEKTSMDDIAKMSHKAKGSLYYHFASKEELFLSVVRHEVDMLKTLLSQVLVDTHSKPFEVLEYYLIKRMEYMSNASSYHQALKMETVQNIDDVANDIFSVSRKEFDHWEAKNITLLLEKARQTNDIGTEFDISIFVNMIQMVLKSLDFQFFIVGKYEQFAKIYNAMIHVIISGMSDLQMIDK